jgi:hypothetical protein
MRKLHVHITPKILYDWTQDQKPEQQQKEFPDLKNQSKKKTFLLFERNRFNVVNLYFV